ncbi:hypothetical protein EW146_g6943 [Bondarzewia mesenterica]|uniref:Glucose-methanol-choline oxidoreductase N-terminal domain-containing protein n=1 Tax=Bondarzewia mesenterica TaxID=1095465 RepID=A0A4S4LMW0_9AGAM|nr:hypothetical protein EW146_g6943 [Bondarzewia mesenterica]
MWPFDSSYPECKLVDLSDEYDFIIAGGGTAGCVLANRLSTDFKSRVLLVERGPLADSWASRVPLLSSDFASDGSRTFKCPSEYQPELGRNLELFGGSVLGGTSRINQMVYTRGSPAEYDAWRDAGRKGWGWEDMKPYFLKSERATYRCDPSVHGTNGEWYNTVPEDLHFPGFKKSSMTVEACRDVGLPFVSDLNSPDHPAFGCGQLHFTRDPQAHRNSTYHAFLPKRLAIERQGNLHICTNTLVEKLEFEVLPDGRQVARAVSLADDHGRKTVRAAKEIILCAGPLASPRILMLSGIGPSEHLKEHGINVVKDLPAVGSNLQDHFGVSVAFGIPMKESLVSLERWPWVFLIELIRYLRFGTGLLLAPVIQLAIFTSSSFLDATGMPSQTRRAEPNSLPDIEIEPMAYDSSDVPFDKSVGVYSFLNVLLRPQSSGTVRLSSSNPSSPSIIDPKYLSSASDLAPLRASLRLTLRICERMRARGYALEPLHDYAPEAEDDVTLDRFIRRRNRTTYHYSSTCRMAPEHDPKGGGVVDDELRVYGVERLRIADSSVFPWVLGAHLQAPTVAVAEKCADMIVNGRRE